MASLKASERSINLKVTEEEDNEGDDDNEEDDEMKNLREEHRISSVWKTGGDLKNEVLWKLEKLFSSFVTKLENEELNEVTYETLLSAHKSVTRATKLLTDSDNYTTRDFTIHIASKKWVSSTLVPLMELGVEDRDLTMRCCRLLMVLTRNLNFDARTFSTLEVKRLKGKETKEEGMIRFTRETASKANAQQQISAFLSFKEAVCTENCSLAITNLLYHLWKTEKEERREREEKRVVGNTNDFTKREVATCLSYIRRILQVDAVPCCSSPGEIITAKSIHNKLIVQLRGALLVVPVICAELSDKYNDVWLTDILRIIYFVLREHDPRDFFRVWKEKCLIGDDYSLQKENAPPLNESESNTKHSVVGSKVQPSGLKSFPVPASLAKRAPSQASKGVLGGILGRERAERAKRAEDMSRHSRFGGQYRVSLSSNSTASATDRTSDDPLPTQSTGAVAKMISRPFSCNYDSVVPQAKAKRSKKNITFAQVDPYTSVAGKDAMEADGQKACVVAATLAERICTGMGLKQLVMRVGIDRVREEGIITMDKEIIFFDVISSLLKYNRLKLTDAKSEYENKMVNKAHGLINDFSSEGGGDGGGAGSNSELGSTGVGSGSKGWVPSLQNVINSLDTMSFRRVFESLEKLQTTQIKRFSDMVSPLGLYKEMMCYLRVLLESTDETHNEFAIARLYSIFYTSSERKDPLPRILAEWTPGLYSRKHLNVLVELVHETLKTLDCAASKYANPSAEKPKKKPAKGKKAMDLEQYMAGCLNFETDEYFKRYLATNQTVRMYTRLLSYHASNDAAVNHYAYSYFQRMCSFRLQQDYPAPSRPPYGSKSFTDSLGAGAAESSGTAATVVMSETMPSEPEDALTLGHMLFNLNTLSVFTDVLSETQTAKPKTMEPLVRLIKSVIRRFEKAVHKNHELLSDALFQHAHVHSFIMEVDSVFEASTFASGYRIEADRYLREKEMEKERAQYDAERAHGGESTAQDRGYDAAVPRTKSRLDEVGDESGEGEDEFNEEDYRDQERITKKSIHLQKKKAAREKKGSKRRSTTEDDGSDDEEEKEEDEEEGGSAGDAQQSRSEVSRLGRLSKKRGGGGGRGASNDSDSDDVQLSDSDNDKQSNSSNKPHNPSGSASGNAREDEYDDNDLSQVSGHSDDESKIHRAKTAQSSTHTDTHTDGDGERAGTVQRRSAKAVADDDSDDDADVFSMQRTQDKNRDKIKDKGNMSKKKDKEKDKKRKLSRPSTSQDPVRTGKSSSKWTREEDNILREQYKLFRGSRSVFDVIAMDPDLLAIGNNRNVASVGRRVKELNLPSQMDISTNGEDEGNQEEEEEVVEEVEVDGSEDPHPNGTPIDFGTDSDSDADVAYGDENGDGGKSKGTGSSSSLEKGSGIWGSDEDSDSGAGNSDLSKKRKGEDLDAPTQSIAYEDESQATQPQNRNQSQSSPSQSGRESQGGTDRRRKLLKRSSVGGDSDSDGDLFSGPDPSDPMGTAETIMQDSLSGAGRTIVESVAGGKIFTAPTRSRTTIVDSDED